MEVNLQAEQEWGNTDFLYHARNFQNPILIVTKTGSHIRYTTLIFPLDGKFFKTEPPSQEFINTSC